MNKLIAVVGPHAQRDLALEAASHLNESVPVLGASLRKPSENPVPTHVIKLIVCEFCHKGGGTLIRLTDKRNPIRKYAHAMCRKAAESVRLNRSTRFK